MPYQIQHCRILIKRLGQWLLEFNNRKDLHSEVWQNRFDNYEDNFDMSIDNTNYSLVMTLLTEVLVLQGKIIMLFCKFHTLSLKFLKLCSDQYAYTFIGFFKYFLKTSERTFLRLYMSCLFHIKQYISFLGHFSFIYFSLEVFIFQNFQWNLVQILIVRYVKFF